MKIKPLGEYVILEAITEEVTSSGIVLVENENKPQPERGKVVAYGPGRVAENGSTIEMSVKLNDIVMFRRFAPEVIKVDGYEYLMLKESDIIAVLGE